MHAIESLRYIIAPLGIRIPEFYLVENWHIAKCESKTRYKRSNLMSAQRRMRCCENKFRKGLPEFDGSKLGRDVINKDRLLIGKSGDLNVKMSRYYWMMSGRDRVSHMPPLHEKCMSLYFFASLEPRSHLRVFVFAIR